MTKQNIDDCIREETHECTTTTILVIALLSIAIFSSIILWCIPSTHKIGSIVSVVTLLTIAGLTVLTFLFDSIFDNDSKMMKISFIFISVMLLIPTVIMFVI